MAEMKGTLRLSHLTSGSEPHLRRLTRLFSPKEQRQLLQYLYDTERQALARSSSYSLEQFVAFYMFYDPLSLSQLDDQNESDDEVARFALISPAEIKLSKLEDWAREQVSAACEGQAPIFSARLLSKLVVTEVADIAQDSIRDTLRACLDRPISTPEIGAAVSQCLLHNERLCDLVAEEARLVSDHALIVLPGSRTPMGAEHEYGDEVEKFVDSAPREAAENLHWFGSDDLPKKAAFYHAVRDDLELAERFDFVESKYGLLVPRSITPRLTADFDQLIARASKDRSTLMALSPREFERFMADLFSSLGYEVELTKPTRDNGVDLVCIRNLHGVPFRMVVELKRYTDGRPITVDMIRSFVGANAQFDANKLLFVTTSRYTKPAIDFAETYNQHLLALRDYDQIKEWCDEVQIPQWKLYR